MSFFDDLKKKYTELLNPVKQSLNDDKGFVQKGKLTLAPITNYFNPTSNAGNNFWSTPVAKTLSSVQSFNQRTGVEPAANQFVQSGKNYLNQAQLAGQTALSVPLQKLGVN
jgi:hypothetical protein